MSRWVEDRINDFGRGVADSLGSVLKEENWHLHGNYGRSSDSTETVQEEETSPRHEDDDDSSDDSDYDASSDDSQGTSATYSGTPQAREAVATAAGGSVIGRVLGTLAVAAGLLLVGALIVGATENSDKK